MGLRHQNIPTRGFLALVILLFQPVFLVRSATAALTPDAGRFPSVQATNLDKQKMRLPQGFSGQMNLVVISFAREQQQDVDTWIPAARQIEADHKTFSYYELSAMSEENILARWWFDSALRSDTTDGRLRSRILTVYVSQHKFLKSLQIRNEKQVVAILVDQAGKVYWRAEGRCTDQKKLAMVSAITAAGA